MFVLRAGSTSRPIVVVLAQENSSKSCSENGAAVDNTVVTGESCSAYRKI